MQVDVQQIRDRVAEQAESLHRLNAELRKVIVGQEQMISRLLIGMLTHGHVLLEGVPGLAKTTAIKSLAEALSTVFRRIQFMDRIYEFGLGFVRVGYGGLQFGVVSLEQFVGFLSKPAAAKKEKRDCGGDEYND